MFWGFTATPVVQVLYSAQAEDGPRCSATQMWQQRAAARGALGTSRTRLERSSKA